MEADIRHVKPGGLRVSPMRPEGADPMKLQDQFNEFGFSVVDMPPIEVTLGLGGEMMINNGMTRAARCCIVNSEQPVAVEIIDVRTEWDFRYLPTSYSPLTPTLSG